MIRELPQSFWDKVDRSGTCWNWLGAKSQDSGHGQWWDPDKQKLVYAHVAMNEALHGPLPEGVVVLHRCDNPACVWDAHHERGTRGDNNRDRHEKGRDAVGEQNGAAKLTDAARATLVRLYHEQVETAAELGRRFGLSTRQVFNLVKKPGGEP